MGRYNRTLAATPNDVSFDTSIIRPRSEKNPVGGEFPRLQAAMNRVEVFDYPVHTRTLDVAYRTIAYQQHPTFVRESSPMVEFPERTVHSHYARVTSLRRGTEQTTGVCPMLLESTLCSRLLLIVIGRLWGMLYSISSQDELAKLNQ
jgi:hypothetical protein